MASSMTTSQNKYRIMTGHSQSNEQEALAVSATSVGELVVGCGNQSCAIVYDTNELISTMTLTWKKNNANVTKTYTFTHNAESQITGYTVT